MDAPMESTDLERIRKSTAEDVENLELQIRKLLSSMEAVDSIRKVPVMHVTQELEGEGNAERELMEWSGPEDSRIQRKGKTMPHTKDRSYRGMEVDTMDLSALEKLEIGTKKLAEKYVAVEDSLFFLPVLERCVFGITLLNASAKKLRAPTVRLNLIPVEMPETTGKMQAANSCDGFLYDVVVLLNDKSLSDLNTSGSSIYGNDTFLSRFDKNLTVGPGGEVLVVANFANSAQFVEKMNSHQLLVSVRLAGKELWARKIPIPGSFLDARFIDSTFKKHKLDIIRGFGTEVEGFELRRSVSKEDKDRYPKRALESFVTGLGYESVASYRTETDKSVEYYTTNQPSLFWGSCLKVETCSRKPSSARCIFTARTTEQMKTFQQSFRQWLQKEVDRDKRRRSDALKAVPLIPNASLKAQEKFHHEIDLFQRLQHVKHSVKDTRKLIPLTPKSYAEECAKNNELTEDAAWIKEYASAVAKTDEIFVAKMV